MDVTKALRELYAEKKLLDAAITTLEGKLRSAARDGKRRGRKSMSADERLEVSRRMSRYWAARRGKNSNRAAASATAPSS